MPQPDDIEYRYTVIMKGVIHAPNRDAVVNRLRAWLSLSLPMHESLDTDGIVIEVKAVDQLAELRKRFGEEGEPQK